MKFYEAVGAIVKDEYLKLTFRRDVSVNCLKKKLQAKCCALIFDTLTAKPVLSELSRNAVKHVKRILKVRKNYVSLSFSEVN